MNLAKLEYDERMRSSEQFARLRLKPTWRPGEGDITGFCYDEVVRQYHDPRVHHDGGVRVQWMYAAWSYARSRAGRSPTLDDIKNLGQMVEPHTNTHYFFRSQNVYIGYRAGFPPSSLNDVVTHLARRTPEMQRVQECSKGYWPAGFNSEPTLFIDEDIPLLTTADDWYLAYEWVHPWADGNGRTGKILHNWLLGTLDEPVLVDDYFGMGNP